MRSEVKRWLHTLSKYSLPWFPHRKQPCDVSDDPEARIRAINRKWLSSKLHPIIITERKKKPTDKQSKITTRHKVIHNTDKRPQTPAQTYNSPEKQHTAGTQTASLHAVFTNRTSNASIYKIKSFST